MLSLGNKNTTKKNKEYLLNTIREVSLEIKGDKINYIFISQHQTAGHSNYHSNKFFERNIFNICERK